MTSVRKGDQAFPFSRGIMARSMSQAGMPVSEAYEVVGQILSELDARGVEEVESRELRGMVSQKMIQAGWENEERFYRVQRYIKHKSEPIFILIGGTTGVGKSTMSAEIGHRLGINRVIGTDTIREIMRSIISENLIPTLHKSTFEAANVMKLPTTENRLVEAFREQCRVVNEGLAAVVRRGAKEGLHMVLNGVHIVPGFLERCLEEEPEHIFRFVLTVPEEQQHEMFFFEREQASRRSAERYVENMQRIRDMQDYILKMADRYEVSVVPNREFEDTLKEIIREVITAFDREVDNE
ncbi:MAG: 2-phosphoglycerate kinase [Planctomycetota bacterium]